MLLKIITNTLKKVLFSDDKNTQHVHKICCSVGLKLTCGAILLSWFWPERAFIRKRHVDKVLSVSRKTTWVYSPELRCRRFVPDKITYLRYSMNPPYLFLWNLKYQRKKKVNTNVVWSELLSWISAYQSFRDPLEFIFS